MALNVVEIWRDLHKTPELGFEENKTSAYLAEALEKLGFAVTRGVGKTGVMGVIRGAEPGPVLMLRADMDALPFRNDDGSIEAVHACGHDSHCAMVLAAASELAGRVRRGTLKILFQPGEETLHGALEVLKSGAVDDVDIALGCHVRPIQDIPTGTCAAAVRHTSSTFADIVIHGRTAHASRPHLGVNCAEVAAAVTQAVAAIKGDPAKVWSCKVTSIQACAAAATLYGGPKTCTFACIGLGDCTKVCKFDAIHIVDGVAKVDKDKCTGCGACANICPKHVIMIDAGGPRKPVVMCSNQDKGAVANKLCTTSCIACGMCERTCKFDAIHVVDGVARVDYDKCKGCGMCAQKCPKHIILFPLKDDPNPPKPVVKQAPKPAAAPAAPAEPAAKAEEAKAPEAPKAE